MEKTTIENAIKENGFYLSIIVGDSMMPLLRNRRDTVKIIPVSGRLKNMIYHYTKDLTENMCFTE